MIVTGDTYSAVRACALALLAGAVLHAADVTAGNGKVIDWRTVRCGETIREGADPFDAAHLFVVLVGEGAARSATESPSDPTPPPPPPGPEITAYRADEHGFRIRQFTVGAVRVRVEGLSWLGGTDAEAESFAERLAAAAAGLT